MALAGARTPPEELVAAVAVVGPKVVGVPPVGGEGAGPRFAPCKYMIGISSAVDPEPRSATMIAA